MKRSEMLNKLSSQLDGIPIEGDNLEFLTDTYALAEILLDIIDVHMVPNEITLCSTDDKCEITELAGYAEIDYIYGWEDES